MDIERTPSGRARATPRYILAVHALTSHPSTPHGKSAARGLAIASLAPWSPRPPWGPLRPVNTSAAHRLAVAALASLPLPRRARKGVGIQAELQYDYEKPFRDVTYIQ